MPDAAILWASLTALVSACLCRRGFTYRRLKTPAVPLEPLGAVLPLPSVAACGHYCGSRPSCAAFQSSGGQCRLLAVSAADQQAAPAPAGPVYQLSVASATYSADGGRWRTAALVDAVGTRSAAAAACRSLRPAGRLPIIHSQLKNEHVRAVLAAVAADGWLGMDTADIEPYGFWEDGSPLDWTNWDAVTSPEKPEPNRYARNDTQPVDSAALDPDGLWFDTAATLRKVPLCDQPLD